ncbi:MAG: hypothetical protein COT81_05525 [Candidatus Buchananbacteria bacterium CG10_big_fil_rev_8_21_14_0_10_42_9]|uniref:Uncharacterized protein n=1 Tax=Candidatus Buchananbacteria bacterium CG10_big_fil_rev_8_21_14_0_10_42_9 TaxID=1974526 RepID=A0A2H0VZW7_9BACT|nr:MAG: hypothetical protein COT81_05525 [Candidatus Buchananbacteria bacterium CG10_big_fil_rev_8_21_14_0_10_42_9]
MSGWNPLFTTTKWTTIGEHTAISFASAVDTSAAFEVARAFGYRHVSPEELAGFADTNWVAVLQRRLRIAAIGERFNERVPLLTPWDGEVVACEMMPLNGHVPAGIHLLVSPTEVQSATCLPIERLLPPSIIGGMWDPRRLRQ